MTTDQKIAKVLTCCGKAPRSAWAFDDAEKAAVAALCGDDGLLVAGGQEKFRLLMVDHYERRKATSEEFEAVQRIPLNPAPDGEWTLQVDVYEPPTTEPSE